jgi:hypothetical protein
MVNPFCPSKKLVAVLTGIEPVLPERQSSIVAVGTQNQSSGCFGRSRTHTIPINSRALYQLSYKAILLKFQLEQVVSARRLIFQRDNREPAARAQWWVRKDLNLQCPRRLVYSQVQYRSATHPFMTARGLHRFHNTFRPSSGLLLASGKILPLAFSIFGIQIVKVHTTTNLKLVRVFLAGLEDTISRLVPMGSSSGIAPEFLGSQPSVLSYWTTTNIKKWAWFISPSPPKIGLLGIRS